LPASDFAGPGRSYPVDTKGRARAAKSRAAEFASPGERKKIDAKADKRLGKKKKGAKAKPHRFSRDAVLSRPDME
jgi:hypothetical protein